MVDDISQINKISYLMMQEKIFHLSARTRYKHYILIVTSKNALPQTFSPKTNSSSSKVYVSYTINFHPKQNSPSSKNHATGTTETPQNKTHKLIRAI
jgi:hypothetical protein